MKLSPSILLCLSTLFISACDPRFKTTTEICSTNQNEVVKVSNLNLSIKASDDEYRPYLQDILTALQVTDTFRNTIELSNNAAYLLPTTPNSGPNLSSGAGLNINFLVTRQDGTQTIANYTDSNDYSAGDDDSAQALVDAINTQLDTSFGDIFDATISADGSLTIKNNDQTSASLSIQDNGSDAVAFTNFGFSNSQESSDNAGQLSNGANYLNIAANDSGPNLSSGAGLNVNFIVTKQDNSQLTANYINTSNYSSGNDDGALTLAAALNTTLDTSVFGDIIDVTIDNNGSLLFQANDLSTASLIIQDNGSDAVAFSNFGFTHEQESTNNAGQLINTATYINPSTNDSGPDLSEGLKVSFIVKLKSGSELTADYIDTNNYSEGDNDSAKTLANSINTQLDTSFGNVFDVTIDDTGALLIKATDQSTESLRIQNNDSTGNAFLNFAFTDNQESTGNLDQLSNGAMYFNAATNDNGPDLSEGLNANFVVTLKDGSQLTANYIDTNDYSTGGDDEATDMAIAINTQLDTSFGNIFDTMIATNGALVIQATDRSSASLLVQNNGSNGNAFTNFGFSDNQSSSSQQTALDEVHSITKQFMPYEVVDDEIQTTSPIDIIEAIIATTNPATVIETDLGGNERNISKLVEAFKDAKQQLSAGINADDGFCIYDNKNISIENYNTQTNPDTGLEEDVLANTLKAQVTMTYDPFNGTFAQNILLTEFEQNPDDENKTQLTSFVGFYDTPPTDFKPVGYSPPTVRYASVTNSEETRSFIIDDDFLETKKLGSIELQTFDSFCTLKDKNSETVALDSDTLYITADELIIDENNQLIADEVVIEPNNAAVVIDTFILNGEIQTISSKTLSITGKTVIIDGKSLLINNSSPLTATQNGINVAVIQCADNTQTIEPVKDQCNGGNDTDGNAQTDLRNRLEERLFDLNTSITGLKRLRVETDYANNEVRVYISKYKERVLDADENQDLATSSFIDDPGTCEKQAILDELAVLTPGIGVSLKLVPDSGYDFIFKEDSDGNPLQDENGSGIIDETQLPTPIFTFTGTAIPSRQ